MIIGIIPITSIETLLNNLSEAGFSVKTVSVVMQDVNLRNKITKDAGPFKGITVATLANKLTQLGMSASDAQAYVGAVNKGGAFVAIAPPAASQQAALEMLNDYKPQLVKVMN